MLPVCRWRDLNGFGPDYCREGSDLIPSARIHCGFHRLGVVLVVPLLLRAAIFAFQGHSTDGVLVVCIAVFTYVVARAVGWVLAGFIGSSRP